MKKNSQTKHRPASVTFMALGVLMIAVINLIRAGEALTGWRLWTGLLPISPVYLLGSGLFWAIVCLPLAWGLWQGQAWAGRFTPLAAWTYSLYYWLDLAFLKQGAEKNNLIFLIAANIILLAAMHWVLWKSQARF